MLKRTFYCLALLALLSVPVRAETVLIREIESARDRGFDYLDIYTTGYAKGKGLLLEDRLQIDFPGAGIADDIRITRGRSTRIKDILAGTADDGSARITVLLARDIDYEIVNVFGRDKSVVEICDRVDRAEKIIAAWESVNLKEKGEKIESYKLAPAKNGKLPLTGKTIVIDPGHGGRDPGTISLSGIPEKTLTLQTARKTAYLLKLAGATVYLTRNTDRKYNLRDIVDFANKVKADILISIHYNFSGIRSASGTETYYYTGKSRGLALELHRNLINGLKRRDRGLRKAMLYLCHHAEMPSVVVEPVYISNPDEDRLIREESFQKDIAENLVRGVKAYFFRSRNR